MGAWILGWREFGKPLSSSVLWTKSTFSFSATVQLSCTSLSTAPVAPEQVTGWPLDFCFIRFCENSLRSLLFILFIPSERIVLHSVSYLFWILYRVLRSLCLSLLKAMFLHYLWVGPLQAVAVTTPVLMEEEPCLAGMWCSHYFSAFAKLCWKFIFIHSGKRNTSV